MKKQLVAFMCIAVLLFGCKKEDSSSTNSGGNNNGGGGSTPNYVLDNFIGTYSGTLNETSIDNRTGKEQKGSGELTTEIKKISDTQVKFSSLTGNFSNGKIIFPKQQVSIGSLGYNATGTAELVSDNNLKIHLDLKDGVIDTRVQEFDLIRQ